MKLPVGAMLCALGCASTPPPSRVVAPALRTAVRPAAPAGSVPRFSAEWVVLAPRQLPLPLTSIAAVSRDRVVLASDNGLFAWSGDRVTPLCTRETGRALTVAADGDRFVAIATRDGDVGTMAGVVWSDNAGQTCSSTTVAGLARENPATLAIRLVGEHVVVWSAAGVVARSDDGGASWRTLPYLPSIVTAIPTVTGDTLAFARVAARGGGVAEPGDARRWLYAARSARDAPWRRIEVGPSRRGPIGMSARADGVTAGVDAVGTFEIDAAQHVAAGSGLSPFLRPSDTPHEFVPAGPNRFVGITDIGVVEVTPTATRSVAPVPRDLEADTQLDAIDDVLWLADRRGLRRSVGGEPFVDVTTRTLTHGEPRVIAARGESLALISSAHYVSASSDRGEHWREDELRDRAVRRVAAFDSSGALLVLGNGSLSIRDAHRTISVALPARAGASVADALRRQPDVFTGIHFSDRRWIVLDGRAMTSDDQGARWHVRLEPASDALGAGHIVAAVFHGASGIVLDSRDALWRTDDGASTWRIFARMHDVVDTDRPRVRGEARLAWDGRDRILVLRRPQWLETNDGGTVWTPRPAIAQTAELFFLPDGRLAAWTDSTERCHRDARGRVLEVESTATHQFALARDACSHPAAAWTTDGFTLVIANQAASIRSIDVRGL